MTMLFNHSKFPIFARPFAITSIFVVLSLPALAKDKDMALRSAARQMIDAAIAEMPRIADAEGKATAYFAIANLQAKMGDSANARKNLNLAKEEAVKIVSTERQVEINRQIITALAHAGAFEQANALDQAISDKNKDDYRAYIALLEVQANAGKIEAALATLEKISNDSAKATAYCMIAREQFKQKNEKEGRQSLDRARKILAESKDPLYYKPFVLFEMVEVYADAGDYAEAQAAITQFEDMNKLSEAIVYKILAMRQAKRNDFPAAMKTADIVKAIVEKSGKNDSKPFIVLELENTYATIAEELARSGDVAGGKATAMRIKDPGMRCMAFLGIASQQAKKGDATGARQCVDIVKMEAKNISGGSVRMSCYVGIADIYGKVGDERAVRESMESAQKDADEMEKEKDRDGAYKEIACAYAYYCHEIPRAKSLVAQIRDHDNRLTAYQHIAAEEARSGDITGAIQYIIDAEADPRKRCYCLTSAAEMLCSDD